MKVSKLIKEAKELMETGADEAQLIEKQIEIEEVSDGFEREYREGKRLEDVLTRPSDDPLVRRIISAIFEDVVTYFDNVKNATQRGRGAKYRKIIRGVDTEVLAGAVIVNTLNSVMGENIMQCTFQKLSHKLGRAIVTELKVAQAKVVSPFYMMRVENTLKGRNARDLSFISKVYDNAFQTVTCGKLEYDLGASDLMHLGKFGLEALIEAGLIYADKFYYSHKEWSVYKLSESIRDYVMTVQPELFNRALSSQFRFMIVKPDEWTGMAGGGFKSPMRKMYHQLISLKSLNRSMYHEYKERFTPENMPKVFNFINSVQSVPYKLNKNVINLIERIYDMGGGLMGIPSRDDPPAPEFPYGEDWSKHTAPQEELEVFYNWKNNTRMWHEDSLKRKQQIRTMKALFQAVQHNLPYVYFPCYFDFRGRLYYNSNPSPQGTDISKACLDFYNAKPLGKDGLYWLKVHLANSLGYDKTRMDDRVAYVDKIWDSLANALSNPIEHSDAFGDESPLVAYHTAVEIKNALDSGDPESYVCGVPIHMDATVSGTQHFSALLRDEIGGEFTNLIDYGQDFKADLYSRVGELAIESMKQDLGGENDYPARFWIEEGIPRKLAKKPVMTYTYGVTKANIKNFVEEYLRENYKERTVELNHQGTAMYLTNKLFEAIENTIPATVNGMRYLQNVAREVGTAKMDWYNPVGFWVHFNSLVQESKRITVRSAGVNLVWVKSITDQTNKAKMINGISPQFIHSLDASHLCLVGNAMADRGLEITCVHDSIGTLPCNVTEMHSIIRSQFVNMYSGTNILENFRSSVCSNLDLPEVGKLDINNVLESEFFFC